MNRFTWAFLIIFCLWGVIGTNSGLNGLESRYVATAVALESEGTFSIDSWAPLTNDIAIYQDRYYAAAAPGMSILLVPPAYLIDKLYQLIPYEKRSRIAEKVIPSTSYYDWLLKQDDLDGASWATPEKRESLFRYYMILNSIKLLVSGVLSFLLAMVMLRLYTALSQAHDRKQSFILILCIFVSTNLLFYSPRVTQHILGASLIVIVLLNFISFKKTGLNRYIFLAGLVSSLLPIVDYPLGVVSILLGLFSLLLINNFKNILFFALGALIGSIFFVTYHYVIFGGPFTLPHHFMISDNHRSGLYGINLPTIENYKFLLLSQEKGYFVYAPLMILAIIGIFKFIFLSRGIVQRIAIFSLITSFVLLSVNASYLADPSGGVAWGPRYLLPTIPLLGWGLLQFWSGWKKTVILALALIMLPIHLLGTFSPINMSVNERPIEDMFDRAIENGISPHIYQFITRVISK